MFSNCFLVVVKLCSGIDRSETNPSFLGGMVVECRVVIVVTNMLISHYTFKQIGNRKKRPHPFRSGEGVFGN